MLLPYQRHVFNSSLSVAEVIQRLEGAVQPARWLRFSAASVPFEGVVMRNSFRIKRIIRYRNSFLPQLHGSVAPRPDGGARVVVVFHIHPAVAIIVAYLLLLMLAFGLATAVSAGVGKALLHIGIAFMFSLALVLGSFVPEARKAARLLEGLLCSRAAE